MFLCHFFQFAPLNAKDAERLPLRSKVRRRSGRATSERASEPCDEDGLRVALPSVRAGIIEAVSWLLLWCSEGLFLIFVLAKNHTDYAQKALFIAVLRALKPCPTFAAAIFSKCKP